MLSRTDYYRSGAAAAAAVENPLTRLHRTSLIFLLILPIFANGLAVSLSDGWSLSTDYNNIRITNRSLPIGVYSEVERSGLSDSLLESYNDVKLRWIGQQNWTFELKFKSPSLDISGSPKAILTFHGVDTVADIRLNDQPLGHTDNMFVRYRFDVTNALKSPSELNLLQVFIKNPVKEAAKLAAENSSTPPNCPPDVYNGECHMNFLRKMQASFSWDWGLAAPSSGIWKEVELEVYSEAVIRDITVFMEHQKATGEWEIQYKVFLETGTTSSALKGRINIAIPAIPGAEITQTIDSRSDDSGSLEVAAKMIVKDADVELWWPNGYGAQTLYDVNVSFAAEGQSMDQPRRGNGDAQKKLRIGFRTIKLIEEPLDGNCTADAGLSFYFEVNGQPVFMKGSNWIPADILPERGADKRRVKHLLRAARDAHMNMLRVWGGGVYESDYFYELADEYGILIWHDLMFACAMYPVFDAFLATVRTEVEQNVRRLQHHASLAIWATNNENEVALVQNWYSTNHERERFAAEYRKLYVDVVLATVGANDRARVCLASSPSNGVVQTLKDDYISQEPQSSLYGDRHYYNYFANAWDWSTYPKARFISEYGFQSYPAYSSWIEILGGDDYLPDLIEHRQHSPLGDLPILTLINTHLPLANIRDEAVKLRAKIYFSQIAQGNAIKTETEYYRVLRGTEAHTMGALYWQLNDVWVAPSWSSIDHLGKFKILHYMAKKFLEPTSIVPILTLTNVVQVHIVNDRLDAAAAPGEQVTAYRAAVRVFSWKHLDSIEWKSWTVKMVANSAFQLDAIDLWGIFNERSNLTVEEHFLQFTLVDPLDQVVSTNYLYPTNLKQIEGVNRDAAPSSVSIDRINCDSFEETVTLTVRTSAPILYFYIDIMNEAVRDYRFSDNGFTIVEPVSSVTVTYPNVDCRMKSLTMEDLLIQTVNQFF